MKLLILYSFYFFIIVLPSYGGNRKGDDSTINKFHEKYTTTVTKKMRRYQKRLTGKTEKTLTKLSRLENRIQKTLKKVSPETEDRLFATGQLTFQKLLQQIKNGELELGKYQAQYDSYSDEMRTSLLYLEKEGGNFNKDKALEQSDSLTQTIRQTEFIASFIAKRKKRLLHEALKYAGNNPALKKLNKETWYYTETLKNYKELFTDAGKREQLAKKLLCELPAYQKFARENSLLASLFAIPPGNSGGSTTASLAGLQTRAGVQEIIQQRISASGPNGAAQIQQNLQDAQTKLSEVKDKLLKGGHIGSDGDIEMPDFKPNGQRSKTLLQRLEYGFDMQFSRNNSIVPATSDIGLSMGYKLNDRSVIGAGISYWLGLGSIEHIRLSSEGVGLRSYLTWKIKGQWHAAGGYELNYRSSFKDIADLKNAAWQRSGLIGISRQYRAGKKLKGEVRLLYDFLYRKHEPQSEPVVFRMGYKF